MNTNENMLDFYFSCFALLQSVIRWPFVVLEFFLNGKNVAIFVIVLA